MNSKFFQFIIILMILLLLIIYLLNKSSEYFKSPIKYNIPVTAYINNNFKNVDVEYIFNVINKQIFNKFGINFVIVIETYDNTHETLDKLLNILKERDSNNKNRFHIYFIKNNDDNMIEQNKLTVKNDDYCPSPIIFILFNNDENNDDIKNKLVTNVYHRISFILGLEKSDINSINASEKKIMIYNAYKYLKFLQGMINYDSCKTQQKYQCYGTYIDVADCEDRRYLCLQDVVVDQNSITHDSGTDNNLDVYKLFKTNNDYNDLQIQKNFGEIIWDETYNPTILINKYDLNNWFMLAKDNDNKKINWTYRIYLCIKLNDDANEDDEILFQFHYSDSHALYCDKSTDYVYDYFNNTIKQQIINRWELKKNNLINGKKNIFYISGRIIDSSDNNNEIRKYRLNYKKYPLFVNNINILNENCYYHTKKKVTLVNNNKSNITLRSEVFNLFKRNVDALEPQKFGTMHWEGVGESVDPKLLINKYDFNNWINKINTKKIIDNYHYKMVINIKLNTTSGDKIILNIDADKIYCEKDNYVYDFFDEDIKQKIVDNWNNNLINNLIIVEENIFFILGLLKDNNDNEIKGYRLNNKKYPLLIK